MLRSVTSRISFQLPCPARSMFDRLGGFQPGGQLLAGVADDVVDVPTVLAAVLGGPQAESQRVCVDRPGRVLGTEVVQEPGDRIAVHSDPPGPPNMGRPSSSSPTVPDSRAATSAASHARGLFLRTAAVPPTSAASRARARAAVPATSTPAAAAVRRADRSEEPWPLTADRR